MLKIRLTFPIIFSAAMILGLFLTLSVAAEDQTFKNPLEWLTELETEVNGHPSDSSLLPRLDLLEKATIGKIRDESIINRLMYLDELLHVNQPHDISLTYKVQALEWILFKRGYSGSIQERVGRIESTLFNKVYAGPFNQRLDKLVHQVFPEGIVKGSWVTLPEGLQVKVKIIDEISSVTNSAGDTFRYEVIETVLQDHRVVFPKGTMGKGVLQMIERPGKLGKDACLSLDFSLIRALDGTPVSLLYSVKSSGNSRPRKLMIASTAGMLVFGPGGILVGLAVKGHEKVIPATTEIYLQVKEPVRVFTIFE
jgi:hypothetical protein